MSLVPGPGEVPEAEEEIVAQAEAEEEVTLEVGAEEEEALTKDQELILGLSLEMIDRKSRSTLLTNSWTMSSITSRMKYRET